MGKRALGLKGLVCAALGAMAGMGAARAAHAEDRGPFVLLDRTTSVSHFAADTSVVFPRDIDAIGLRMDVYGEYVHASHLGLYFQIGWTWLRNGSIRLSDFIHGAGVPTTIINDPFASNNLGLGGLYSLDLGDATVTFHAGATFATSPSDWNLLANYFLIMGRVTEWEQFAPSMNWARGGATLNGGTASIFYQADVSLSLGFPTMDDVQGYNVFHVNAGIGGAAGPIRLLAELANTVTYDESDLFWNHALSLGVRYAADSPWSPHLAYQMAFRLADGVAGHTVMLGIVYTFGQRASGG